jgi:DHA3 family multidrug efflux protein-like MFS transporter
VFVTVESADLLRLRSPWFWALVAMTLVGSVVAQLRSIVLSTCVTLLVPDDQRDRANGMVGTVTGVSFAITSVFSGLVIGGPGHGRRVRHRRGADVRRPRPPGHHPHRRAGPGARRRGQQPPRRGRPGVARRHPGRAGPVHADPAGAFNNLLAGVFMALIDAYGLELVTVEAWGVLWGFISLAFIAGGLAVSRYGLGPNPLRLVLAGNLVNWVVCSVFAVRSSIVLLTIGMVVWLA